MDENVRPDDMERITTPELAQAFIDEQVAAIREQVGDKKVLLALSGGVDSSVVAALLIKAIGKHLVCVHVNHGLMRKGEPSRSSTCSRTSWTRIWSTWTPPTASWASWPTWTSPSQAQDHRRASSSACSRRRPARWATRSTSWPRAPSTPTFWNRKDGVKAHHNVGGLPEDLQFELVEPVKLLYKDEVRVVGRELGLPENMVERQPFPGPGLGVRCLGAITRDRLEALREADAIVREEMEAANVGAWQYFAVVPDMRATGVRDGVRAYEWPAIIRAINTVDVMTAEVPELDWALLKRMTDRITHEVPGICRVCYDLTPKPVGTVEWE